MNTMINWCFFFHISVTIGMHFIVNFYNLPCHLLQFFISIPFNLEPYQSKHNLTPGQEGPNGFMTEVGLRTLTPYQATPGDLTCLEDCPDVCVQNRGKWVLFWPQVREWMDPLNGCQINQASLYECMFAIYQHRYVMIF